MLNKDVEVREFKGIWIPKEIWLDKNLSLQEKVLLAEIDSFEKSEGCFASNRYFAKFFSISKGRISQIVSSLNDRGYVNLEFRYTPGTKEIANRIIRINWRKIRAAGI